MCESFCSKLQFRKIAQFATSQFVQIAQKIITPFS